MSGEVKDQGTGSIDSSSEKQSSSVKTLDTIQCAIDYLSKTEIPTEYPRLVVHYSDGSEVLPPCFKHQTNVPNVYCLTSSVQFKNPLNDATVTSARLEFCEHQQERLPAPEPCTRCNCNVFTLMRLIVSS